MTGTSVRKVAGGLAGLDRAERIATLRARMAAVGAVPTPDVVSEPGLPAPAGLPLSFARRTVTQCSDTPALVLEIIRTVVGDGGFVAIVGWPDLLLADLGEGMANVVAIPDPGPEPLNTVAVLTEGMDLVVYRSEASLQLSPVRARPLLGKLRKGRAALLLVNLQVPSPQASLQAQVVNFHGIGAGTGRIRSLDIQVQVQRKTGHQSALVRVGVDRPRLRVV